VLVDPIRAARPASEIWLAAARLALAAAFALLAAVVPARAGDEAFFRACEVARRAALVGADAAALGALMADGAQYVHSNGDVDDKAKLVSRIANGALRYRTLVVDEEHYACQPSACEVSGTQTLGVSTEGREGTVRNRFRATWLNAAGACKLAAYQSAPLAAN
jgi:hypothetical protein